MNSPNNTWWREEKQTAYQDINTDTVKEREQLSFWAVVGFTFILLLAPQERYPFLAPLRIAMLTAMLAVLAHVYSRISKGLPVVDLIPANKVLLCLLAWIVVTMPFSFWPGGSITFMLGNYLKTLIVYILLGSVIDTTLKLKRISWALALMAIPLALTTIKNFLTGNSMEGNERVLGYMASLTANPNDMALMLNLILPICIALFLDSKKKVLRMLLGLTTCLLVVAIITTFSRAGFLTLGLIFMIYLWRLRKRPERKWGLVVLLIVFFSFPLIPATYFDRINTILNVEEDTSFSAQTRLSDMKSAVSLVIKNPLIGAGVGMNQVAMNEERGVTWTEIHNVYLQYAVELGLPGLAFFLVFFAKCIGTTGTVLNNTRGRASQITLFHITEGIRVSLLGFIVAAMFHPVAYHFYFYFIAGLAVATGEISKRYSNAQGVSWERGNTVARRA